jgi:hypothetical protein
MLYSLGLPEQLPISTDPVKDSEWHLASVVASEEFLVVPEVLHWEEAEEELEQFRGGIMVAEIN